jgi:uncharacterized membrane protein
MESKAKVAGHPIHQMIIVFPLGLLATASIFDMIQEGTGDRRWSEVGHYVMGAGLVSGLTAAVPGLIDYLAIPGGTRAKRIGLLHGVGNVVVTGMYAASWLSRRRRPGNPKRSALALSYGAAALAVVTGWLGGELVDRLGVGVDDGAHLNAPNSLSGRRASESAGGVRKSSAA